MCTHSSGSVWRGYLVSDDPCPGGLSGPTACDSDPVAMCQPSCGQVGRECSFGAEWSSLPVAALTAAGHNCVRALRCYHCAEVARFTFKVTVTNGERDGWRR